jgi:hypothetical protein
MSKVVLEKDGYEQVPISLLQSQDGIDNYHTK